MNVTASVPLACHRARIRGFGLLEFLVALVVFSAGVLLILSNQVAGARLTTESLQRSLATALARDILTRIQLNPARVDAYLIDGQDDIRRPLVMPAVDCATEPCQSLQFAGFELWQWKRTLLGLSVSGGEGRVIAMGAPAACVYRSGGIVSVTLGWRSRDGESLSGTYSCSEGEVQYTGGDGLAGVFFSVTLSTWVGGA